MQRIIQNHFTFDANISGSTTNLNLFEKEKSLRILSSSYQDIHKLILEPEKVKPDDNIGKDHSTADQEEDTVGGDLEGVEVKKKDLEIEDIPEGADKLAKRDSV